MDPQEIPVDLRGGHLSKTTTDAKPPTVGKPLPTAVEPIVKKSDKPKDRQKKSNSSTTTKLGNKTKHKKSKKLMFSRDKGEADSSDDSDSSVDSDDQSETESEPEIVIRKKRVQKKRKDGQKEKKPAKTSKKTPKPKKQPEPSSESESESGSAHSDTNAESGSDEDSSSENDKSTKELAKENAQLRRQLRQDKKRGAMQQIQQQVRQLQIAQGAVPGPGLPGVHNLVPASTGLPAPCVGTCNNAALNQAMLKNLSELLAQQESDSNTSKDSIDQPVIIRGRGRPLGAGGPPPPSIPPMRPPGKQPPMPGHRQQRPANRPPSSLFSDPRESTGTSKLDFKRVNQVWDKQLYDVRLQDTAQSPNQDPYDPFLFYVRRAFDSQGHYKLTIVDIKSKQLREALRDVLGDIRGISLVEEIPKLDPNILFLYLEELREHLHHLKDLEPVGKTRKERKKVQKWIDEKRRHLKVLIKYLDKDYALVKKTLDSLLDAGLITFDLLWALWKPSTMAYTTTYGSNDDPRVFKVDFIERYWTVVKGRFYYVEGKFLEYDGKHFGYGSIAQELPDFRGTCKITSLKCYPLKYHKDEAKLRAELIERGKKFVSLAGAHYKSHQGIAYFKKYQAIVKVNIDGRIMVDPATHRKNNPNYPVVPIVRTKDEFSNDDDDSDDEANCCCDSSDVTGAYGETKNADASAGDQKPKPPPEFADEEYLIASPVVLGFAFAEKIWLELSVSRVGEISWNESAYESLVLEPKTKDIVKALVESHKYHSAESIDDVIQGKGKGLVFVLHGPPGTGKTLTAEGISELLKCPLYCVSAGDLGTDSRPLEGALQRVLAICHAWGAILLLDEADVFLEKRNVHEIHRNALVSIFLRHIEYFQGILFLTTNRIETFDDAFQSRIHIALRYDELDTKAKIAIFKIFIDRVRSMDPATVTGFTERDYDLLARHNLNGRQIKNTVRTAQALAVNRGEPLAMSHVLQFLEVMESFERDLKGGTGYQDAMRSYF